MKILTKLREKLNTLSIKKRLLLIQLICVILPILITDVIILEFLVQAEKKTDMKELNNIADSVRYTLSSRGDAASTFLQEMYVNYDVDQFIRREYVSPLDYYNEHLRMMNTSWLTVSLGDLGNHVTIYTDTEGLVNGGSFQSCEKLKDQYWYEDFMSQEQSQKIYLTAAYSKETWEYTKNISFIKRLDYYDKYSKAIIKLDMDYSKLLRDINNANYESTVYVCYGDTILLSNDGRGGVHAPFELFDEQTRARAGLHRSIQICDRTCDLYIMPLKNTLGAVIRENYGRILLLLLFNVFILLVMLSLIQSEYNNQLRQRETDIARQKAELLALHSQINPHFLFNALESIRMHSIIKRENETADMVEHLALMLRQYVYWGDDYVSVREELRFVEAYLQLQKYRFGDRLNYEIDLSKDCAQLHVPKLTLVTFVENACVHGVEEKISGSWVYVRIRRNDAELIMEIEDTGNGMSTEMCSELAKKMNTAELNMLQTSKSVGMLNAALRLRKFANYNVYFELKAEEGKGTMVTIHLPFKGDRDAESNTGR